MGITGLAAWVKKTKPETLFTISKRFRDPRINNKKVAIDATLLTNQFHFAPVDQISGKQTIIRWYSLIKEMREAGVQPIAIWDERGTREWKAAEAQRRLATRALHLARRNHEDERAVRVEGLREALVEMKDLSVEDRRAIQEMWEKDGWTKYGPPQTQQVTSSSQPFELSSEYVPPLATSDVPTMDTTGGHPTEVPASDLVSESRQDVETEISPKAQAMIDKLSTLLRSYEKGDRPHARTATATELDTDSIEALQHIRDLEVFTGEAAEAGSMDVPVSETTAGKVMADHPIDQVLHELVPFDDYTETPRQMELTRMEGEVIESILGVPKPLESANASADILQEGEREREARQPVSGDHLADLDQELGKIDRLASLMPNVRSTYARALSLPSRQDHEDCKELLVRLGVPVLTAAVPYEAEGLASSLAKKGLVDFVGTEDSDVLAYEGPLLRYVGNGYKPLVYVSGSTLRSQCGFTSEQFLEFCILLGTDASPRIPGVGPVSAYKLIQKYNTIEEILLNEPKINAKVPEGFLDMVNAARRVFTDLPPIPDHVDLDQGVWNDNEVKDWLKKKHGIFFPVVDGLPLYGLPSIQKSEDLLAVKTPLEGVWDDDLEFVEDEEGVYEPDWEEAVKQVLKERGEYTEEDEVNLSVFAERIHTSDAPSKGQSEAIWNEIVREETG